jgi:alkylated DNA repair dioxygenase AlkB
VSVYQPSMLDLLAGDAATPAAGGPAAAARPAPEPLPGRLRRHELTAGAWVDVLPGWVHGSDAVFETLLAEVDWRAERRAMYDGVVDVPRLLRWYGGDETLPHPALADARSRLSAHYAGELGEEFVSAGMCLYRDGRDSVAWHGDTRGRSARVDTMVAIVSFGSPRNLMLRPRAGGHGTLRFPLGHGDLIVMGGSCQRTWEHAIPKTAKPTGPRISVQYRPRDVA